METLEEAIERLIKENYGGVPKFAEKIDVPPTTIYNALRRGMANTRTETTDRIYRELNIDWDTAKLHGFRGLKLKGDAKNPTGPQFVDVPLLGSIAAGKPIDMMESDGRFPAPLPIIERHPRSFFLRVEGDSVNRRIPDGYVALVDPDDREPNERDIFAVCVNGYSATLKHVRKLANGYELVPDSYDPTQRPIVFDYGEEGTDEVTIIGKVIWAAVPFDMDL